jgi:copper chaperone NosL
MFPEFSYLVYIVAGFILLGLLVAIVGKRKLLFGFLMLTVLGAAAALYDFYRWGYDYGHNLDPKAAIQVPGLYYQPPLIGHKTLLNFDAYSYPDKGGWVVVIAGVIMFGVWAFEFYKNRTSKKIPLRNYKPYTAVAALLLLAFSSCSTGPEKIAYGKDACDDCKMTIMDPKFGGEIITKKGRVYKFDDAHCLAHFLKSGAVKEADVAQTVFADYGKEGNFLKSPSLFFVQSPQLKSPMNSNAAAFATQEAANKKAAEVSGTVLDWQTLYTTLK